MLEIPNAITTQINDLCELVEANPVNIKTADAARLTGMNVATYRAAALRGQIPFAIGAKRSADGNGCIKTLTLPFFLYMMNTSGQEILAKMESTR